MPWFRCVLFLLLLSWAPSIALAHEPIKLFEDDGTEEEDANRPPIIINGKAAPAQPAPETGGVVIGKSAASRGAGFGAMRLKFVRRSGTMYVQARVNGREVYFLLDTGASFTTLTPSFAKKVGIKMSKDAPQLRLSTANGTRLARLGLIRTVTLGGRPHRNVTFVECPTCGSRNFRGKPLVGLLGMNILGRYRMDIREQSKEVVLIPGTNFSNRFADVNPWVRAKLLKRKVLNKGGKRVMHFTVGIKNLASRTVSDVAFGLTCVLKNGEERRVSGKVARVRAGKTARVQLELEMTEEGCASMIPGVHMARW